VSAPRSPALTKCAGSYMFGLCWSGPCLSDATAGHAHMVKAASHAVLRRGVVRSSLLAGSQLASAAMTSGAPNYSSDHP
jgi:hypothetical protein